jgi:hypothetical protein
MALNGNEERKRLISANKLKFYWLGCIKWVKGKKMQD